MIKNSIQHFLFLENEIKQEFIKFIKFLKLLVFFNIPFAILDTLTKIYLGEDAIIFSGYMFFASVILLIVYWIPTKKEMKEWHKNHSTF